jgi:hypothetical protein
MAAAGGKAGAGAEMEEEQPPLEIWEQVKPAVQLLAVSAVVAAALMVIARLWTGHW